MFINLYIELEWCSGWGGCYREGTLTIGVDGKIDRVLLLVVVVVLLLVVGGVVMFSWCLIVIMDDSTAVATVLEVLSRGGTG